MGMPDNYPQQQQQQFYPSIVQPTKSWQDRLIDVVGNAASTSPGLILIGIILGIVLKHWLVKTFGKK